MPRASLWVIYYWYPYYILIVSMFLGYVTRLQLRNSYAHEIASLDMSYGVGMLEIWEYSVPTFIQNSKGKNWWLTMLLSF
jgi:hypothetical protein